MGSLLLAGAALLAASSAAAFAGRKPHVITFGGWQKVKWFPAADDAKPVDLRVRPVVVDGRLREYTSGEVHDVTDRLFVVRRAYRLNDALPEEGKIAKWKWEPGGWLSVDRVSGRVAALNFPQFDPFYSNAAWYRDYVAYCGLSDDGEKFFAMVLQLGRKKPALKKALGPVPAAAESECALPKWQRTPARVSFELRGGEKLTFTVRGHRAELAADSQDSDSDSAEDKD